jgi:hypothetical protein
VLLQYEAWSLTQNSAPAPFPRQQKSKGGRKGKRKGGHGPRPDR